MGSYRGCKERFRVLFTSATRDRNPVESFGFRSLVAEVFIIQILNVCDHFSL